jgi:hypothetical protein
VIRRTLVLAVALAGLWAAPAHAASWCGTEATTNRAPELFGGGQVHAVYAIPSDGADHLSVFGAVIETDVESIDSWWRGQDPTRAPRFDLFPFACGAQTDITTVRLPDSGASLSSPDVIFDRLFSALVNAGLISTSLDALVYYDGPVTDPDVCGIGGPSSNGASGLAVVLGGACAGTHSDWTAAHEFGHSIGAVAIGAPHRCPDSGHTCDSTSDLMYPFTSGNPLAVSILDPGRDDYYGHSGGWVDIQDSGYLKHLDAQVHLAVAIVGGGSVASDVAGVNCTATCATDWDAGARVSLTPQPVNGRRFLRWTGDCAGALTCDLTLDASKSVTATFVAATFNLTAAVTGRGTIVSRPAGISCKPRCRHAFASFVPLRLTARPAKGWKLKAWTGACHGKRLVCSVPMRAASTAHATFVKQPKPRKR